MTSIDILAALPALLALIGALLAGHGPWSSQQTVVRVSLVAQRTLFAAAVVLAAVVFIDGPLSAATFQLDRLSAIVTVLTAGISLTVHAFSVRYMDGDAAARRYFRDIGLMSAAILFMVTAEDIVPLAIAWLAASVALASLVGHRRNWPAARASARRTLGFLLVGDVAFVAAAGLAVWAFGTSDVQQIAAAAAASADEPATIGVAVLLVVAAIAKSAQFPLHGWLPETMTAPTPVSALMHAGFVNAGGYLLARFADMFVAQPMLLLAVFFIGALTALIGSAAMLVQPDVKRALAYSTVGQMGFMVMQCGLGAFAAAIYHLVAHGLFKATLFLGAGSVIQDSHDLRNAPAARAAGGASLGRLAMVIGAVAIGAGVALVVALQSGVGQTSLLLATFALMAMVQALAIWTRQPRAAGLGVAIAIGGTVLGFLLYVGGVAAFYALLADELPAPPVAVAPVYWVVPVVFLAALVLSTVAVPRLAALRDRLYVRLLLMGQRPFGGADTFTHRADAR